MDAEKLEWIESSMEEIKKTIWEMDWEKPFGWEKRNEPPYNEIFKQYGVTKRGDLPLWGCQKNIMYALQEHLILPMDIPALFNILYSLEIAPDGKIIWHPERDRPEESIHIDLRAEMNCLCVGSVCPGWSTVVASKPHRVQVFDD